MLPGAGGKGTAAHGRLETLFRAQSGMITEKNDVDTIGSARHGAEGHQGQGRCGGPAPCASSQNQVGQTGASEHQSIVHLTKLFTHLELEKRSMARCPHPDEEGQDQPTNLRAALPLEIVGASAAQCRSKRPLSLDLS